MFATLVIALPSEHKGGEVEASFGDRTIVLDTSSTSPFECSWLAWSFLRVISDEHLFTFDRYADVEHAVRPVTEGHRLVLTYNIIHTTHTPIPSALLVSDEKLRLGRILETWDSSFASDEDEDSSDGESMGPDRLVYLLDHKYTDADLCLAHLKGKDRAKAMLAKETCEAKGFKLFLGQNGNYFPAPFRVCQLILSGSKPGTKHLWWMRWRLRWL